MKDKQTEYSAHAVDTDWGCLVCEGIRAISPCKIHFGFRCFYIHLESLDFYFYFSCQWRPPVLATSTNKDLDQLKKLKDFQRIASNIQKFWLDF